MAGVKPKVEGSWWLYVLECRGGVLYTGIAKDVDARYAAHAAGKGAKFTRMNPPVRVLGKVEIGVHGLALSVEHSYKQLTRDAKLRWCQAGLAAFVLESRSAR